MQPGRTPGFGFVNFPHCANCAGHHSAYSKDCPEWTKQKDITQLKFDKNISFGDAKKIVEQRIQTNTTLSSGSTSYAKVTASANKQAPTLHIQPPKHMQSIETQTELIWPINSERPFNCKATATVQDYPSAHSALKQASGSLTSLSPTTPAPNGGRRRSTSPGLRQVNLTSCHCISPQESEPSRSWREKQTGPSIFQRL
jgi:hypothetical protein